MRAERSVVLTPVELRIARLVAVGRRNDEVAGELALSPKTVEWRLTRIYRKLGVRSRTELAAQLPARRSRGNPLSHWGSKDEPPSPFRFSVSTDIVVPRKPKRRDLR